MTRPRVKLLPPELADKIAAGEVVERPASVVKELVENSLDAGGDRIVVEISGGGLKRISVRDNGIGLTPEDAGLAVKRHATSKISNHEDLFRVRTMGFRGEAVPAIASVSRFSLTSRPSGAESGFRLSMDGGRVTDRGEVGAPPGTTVEVTDLFHNTPARLKFLKTERTETGWIREAVIRLALARPDVHLELIEDGRTGLTFLAQEKMEDRLTEIFGQAVAERLVPVREDHPAVTVTGWISPPEMAKTTSKSVYTFVNRRHIRDRVIMAALGRGYQGRLDRGRHPLAALFLEVEPGTVDVNVHPAKLEVRFHHSQAVHVAVVRAVSTALAGAERRTGGPVTAPASARSFQPGRGLRVAETPRIFNQRPGGGGKTDRYRDRLNNDWASIPTAGSTPPPISDDHIPSTEFAIEAPAAPGADVLTDFRYLGVYANRYLIGQAARDLVLIDQHAAHERLIYNRLTASDPGPGQPLLIPARLTVTPLQAEALNRALPELARFRVDVEPFGPDGRTFVVKSVPAILAGCDPEPLVESMAEDLVGGGSGTGETALAAKLASLACRAAVKTGQELSRAEVESLISDLTDLKGPLTCPHGRPVLIRLTDLEIDSRFKRR